MFEHLSPSVEAKRLTKPSQLKLYLPFLFLAFFVFIFVFSATRGPAGHAIGDPVKDFSSRFVFESFDKQLAGGISNVSLFDFVLENNQAGASLYRLKIGLEGLYDLELIENLKLYHGQTQLGALKTIDKNGNLYFQLADYFLPAGQNHFSLRLTNSYSAPLGTAFNFTILDRADLSLEYKDRIVFPSGNFPAKSGLIVFLEKGYLKAFTDFHRDYFLVSGQAQKIGSFSLVNYGETADLLSLTVSYQGETELSGSPFALMKNNQLLSEAQARDGQVQLILQPRQNINKQRFFEIYALNLPEGKFDFVLEDVQALAYASGQIVGLNDSLSLGSYEVRPYYLALSNGFLNTKLSSGWNQVYELDLRALGADELAVYKLSWEVDYQGLLIDDWELWIDNQPAMVDFSLKDNKLIAKTDWHNPLLVSQNGAKISLLAKVGKISKEATIKVYLATDKEKMTPDSLEANIIWAVGDNFYNSYRLPYLPLSPSILAR